MNYAKQVAELIAAEAMPMFSFWRINPIYLEKIIQEAIDATVAEKDEEIRRLKLSLREHMDSY